MNNIKSKQNETKKFKLYIEFNETKRFKKQFDKIGEIVSFLKNVYKIKDIEKKKEDTYMFYIKNLIMQNWKILNCRKLIIKKFTNEKIYIVKDDSETYDNIAKSLDFIVERNEKNKKINKNKRVKIGKSDVK